MSRCGYLIKQACLGWTSPACALCLKQEGKEVRTYLIKEFGMTVAPSSALSSALE
jgi:hypothetical protein